MPNWCANRIKLTVPAYAQAEVEAWANGTMYPYYKRAINQSIRMFIAGVAGRLKPGIDIQYLPYPALTAHGSDDPTEATLAFSGWVAKLGSNVWLDKSCCHDIDQYYQATGLAGMKWDDLTADEQARVEDVMRSKSHDWSHLWQQASREKLFDMLDAEPEGELCDLRLIFPTRLACELNGFNGRLLESVQSAYDFYCANYGIKWPSASQAGITGGNGWLEIDMDTPWSPPDESIMAALSDKWGCSIDHYFSEAGCDYCGYRRYEEGRLVECIDDSLEYDEEDEHGWSDVIGPDWLLSNVPHYGG